MYSEWSKFVLDLYDSGNEHLYSGNDPQERIRLFKKYDQMQQ